MFLKRIPKPAKRSSRWRSQAHCNFVRSHFCVVPDCQLMPIEVAHVRVGSGAGVGQKPDDWNTIALCRTHHAEQHSIGERSFEKRHAIDMAAIAAEFAKQSPKRREIEAEQKGRNDG